MAPRTKHLVDDGFLGQLKNGAILLNTSRGDVVDERALLKALDAGAVRAGLDVFAQVLDKLSTAGLNVEHMQNRVFRGGQAGLAVIDVAGETSEALLAEIREIPDVLGVSEVTLGEATGRRP